MTLTHKSASQYLPALLAIALGLWACLPAPASVVALRDGSIHVEADGDTLKLRHYGLPCLDDSPPWSPALPQAYGQPLEPIRPLPLMGQAVCLVVVNNTGEKLTPVPVPQSSLVSGKVEFGSSAVLDWAHPGPGEKAIQFTLTNSGSHPLDLRLLFAAPAQQYWWAVPQKKDRRCWGRALLGWDPESLAVVQEFGKPLDRNHAPVAGYRFASAPEIKAIIIPQIPSVAQYRFASAPEIKAATSLAGVTIAARITPDQPMSWWYVFADTESEWQAATTHLLAGKQVSNWQEWSGTHLPPMSDFGSATGIPPADLEPIVRQNIIAAEALRLSNGGHLAKPLGPEALESGPQQQAVVERCLEILGVTSESSEAWAQLAYHNQTSQRSIGIDLLQGPAYSAVTRQGRVFMFAPDPAFPPTRETMDTLLGYALAGGHVTLVDGVHGFDSEEGWWQAAGADDPADYALRLMEMPVDYESRQVMDTTSLQQSTNPFLTGFEDISRITCSGDKPAELELPGSGGFVSVCAADGGSEGQACLTSIGLNGDVFDCLSPAEASILAASYDGVRVAWSPTGECKGRELVGAAYVTYQVPKDTARMELQGEGDFKIYWSLTPPENNWILLKRAYPGNWFKNHLREVSISRLAHPVVYDGTFSCRVFDVSGTSSSPILHKHFPSTQGSFVWLGLPRDYLLLGSDRGLDADTPLRADPGYDLVRFSLLLHDIRMAQHERPGKPPAACWGPGWRQGSPVRLQPELSYYALLPLLQKPLSSASSDFWFRLLDTNSNLLNQLEGYGYRLPSEKVTALPEPSVPRKTDLTTQIGMSGWIHLLNALAQQLGYTGIHTTLSTELEAFDASVARVFGATDEVCFGRLVVDGIPGEAIPLDTMGPELFWALLVVPPDYLPVGAELQASMLQKLGSDPLVETLNDRSRAAASALLPSQRTDLLTGLLPAPSTGILISGSDHTQGYDSLVALPALTALLK